MKIASRQWLPLELWLSIVMVSWGLSGWVGGGLLWQTLHKHAMNSEFGLVLCGTGLAQLFVCSLEWFAGKRWSCSGLLASVRARYWIAFLSVVIWVYVGYVILSLRGPGMVFSLAVQVPAAIVFLVWIYAENLRTAHLLDPAVPTHRLQRQILADREDMLRGRN